MSRLTTDVPLNSRRTTDILHVVLYLHRLGSGRGEETNDTHVVNDTYCYSVSLYYVCLITAASVPLLSGGKGGTEQWEAQ